MNRLPALSLIAAALLAGCDSADRTMSPGRATPYTPTAPATQTLRGMVVENQTGGVYPAFLLQLDDGTQIGLVGGGATPLASVIGAQVEVVGAAPTDLITSDALFEVQSFLVFAVAGADVSDGVIQLIDDVYSLKLTRGGYREIADPPADLANYVGDRIWLTMGDDGSPLTFGVIQAQGALQVARLRR
jgi:hypothetical protein